MTELATVRLALSEITEADAAFMLELLNEPGWIANIGDRGVRDLDGARAYIRDRMAPNLWLVARDAAGEAVGVCGLLVRESLQKPEIGYAFLERHSGKGYATEAAAAMLAHAREVLGHKEVVALTSLDNVASQRVLARIGFTPSGIIELPEFKEPSAYFTA